MDWGLDRALVLPLQNPQVRLLLTTFSAVRILFSYYMRLYGIRKELNE